MTLSAVNYDSSAGQTDVRACARPIDLTADEIITEVAVTEQVVSDSLADASALMPPSPVAPPYSPLTPPTRYIPISQLLLQLPMTSFNTC